MIVLLVGSSVAAWAVTYLVVTRGQAAARATRDAEQAAGSREAGAAFEIDQVELPPGGTTVSRTHLDDGVEDVYVVTAGDGWLVVDGEQVPGPDGLSIVAVCGAA